MTLAAAPQAIMNWSGGKDSALALHRLRQQGTYGVHSLLTTVNNAFGRVSMHGVRQELIQAQADRLALPLHVLRLPEETSMSDYARLMAETLAPCRAQGVTHSVFGDIFLEDLRQWREAQLQPLGLKGVFPLWGENPRTLLEEFWQEGFQTVVVAINGHRLDRSFCGRLLDRAFIADLPASVDPCGENGEFHTFVVDAPYFSQPLAYSRGEIREHTYSFTDADGHAHVTPYFFADLLPNP